MIDPLRAAHNCRCQDPQGIRGHIYLSPFCAYVSEHKLLREYGNPQTVIMRAAQEYHRAWMAGEYNDLLPPGARPGYRQVSP